jgi:hypothetical protein
MFQKHGGGVEGMARMGEKKRVWWFDAREERGTGPLFGPRKAQPIMGRTQPRPAAGTGGVWWRRDHTLHVLFGRYICLEIGCWNVVGEVLDARAAWR